MISKFIVRYCYPGCTQRNGRVVILPISRPPIPHSAVFQALQTDGVDLSTWRCRYYDTHLEGYRLMSPCTVDGNGSESENKQYVTVSSWRSLSLPSHGSIDNSKPLFESHMRLDVQLERYPDSQKHTSLPSAASVVAHVRHETTSFNSSSQKVPSSGIVSINSSCENKLDFGTSTKQRVLSLGDCFVKEQDKPVMATAEAGTGDGYFGIGIYGGKTSKNLGTLWRSAWQLGASYCFVVGQRFKKEATDTVKAWRRIPMYEFEDWNNFAQSRPFQADWVAVEMGGTDIENFEHPKRAVYILGSEDNGLSSSILRACKYHVSLPTTSGRSPSLNVAVTGSLILYDREVKRLRNEQKQKLMCQKGKQMMNQTSKIQKRMPEQDDSNSPVFKKIGVKKKSSPHDLRHDGIGGRNGVDSIKPSQLRYSGKH